MPDNQKLAGLLLFVGGLQWILAVTAAEALYPGYNIANNYISDLGVGPSAVLFNASTLLFGLLVVAAAYNIQRAMGSRGFAITVYLTGIGATGVGIFNENIVVPHAFFALITFIFGGVAAIYSKKFSKPQIGYTSVVLGVVALGAFVLFLSGVYLGLGVGGMERMVAYPTLLWIVGFGGYLVGPPNFLKKLV